MRIVIAYESMFGNTRLIAEAVAKGLQGHDVRVLPLATAEQGLLERADLLVVGAPTHVHGMSRPSSRKSAGELAAKPASGVTLEPHAEGSGVREWLENVKITGRVAVFDTRMRIPRFLSGSAAKGIARRLRRQGARVLAAPTSFFVTKANTLQPGEIERATEWGRSLVAGWPRRSDVSVSADRRAS